MSATGFIRKFKPFDLITEEQVESVHRGTLQVLEKTGVVIKHKRALDLCEKNGCKVDHQLERVCFPPKLVEEALAQIPSTWVLRRRGEKNDVTIGGNTVIMATACGMETVELGTWERRPATRKEVYDTLTVIDALENCHMSGAYAPFWGYETVPPVMAIPEACAARIRNTVKVGWEGCWADCETFTIQMAKAAGTEIAGQCAASSPLTFYKDVIDTLFRFVEADLPCMVGSGATMGASSPATIAGASIVGNAETIAGMVVGHLIKPGFRTVNINFLWPMNMRTGGNSFGNIGVCLQSALATQLCRKYGIPAWLGAPGATSGKAIDFQCGYEKAIAAILSSLYGANILWFIGGIHGELTFHAIQAILDNDIAGMIGRYLQGVEVSDETLAVDLINEIGPIPGNYLHTAHTRKWWKNEQYIQKVIDSLSYQEWEASGQKTALDHAREEMEHILATHRPTPLPPGADEEIERILNDARQFYRKQGMISAEEWSSYSKMLAKYNVPH